MDIVQVTSELAPMAKVGGLGDAVTGLSKALVKKGHKVRVFLPKYDILDYHLLKNLHVVQENVLIEEENEPIPNTLWQANFDGLEIFLVEAHHPKDYFERKAIYGQHDDPDRFLYFSKVVSTILEAHSPDIIHLHDWLTAGCVLFLEKRKKTVFTIHNFEYQGLCDPEKIKQLGIWVEEEILTDPINPESYNLLKGAIQLSDALTTVSPTYAKELLDPEEKTGLEKVLAENKKKLRGILNGIDTDYWNPKTDSFLVKNYTNEDFFQGKKENKQHVQRHLRLTEDEKKPLVVAITRLVPQKGPDLIQYGIEKAIEMNGQFVVLGSTSDPEMRATFEQLKNVAEVAIHLDYDEPLAHLLYAASDMLLMPSIFEPCGLSQMIALRYGTIPLVHATGGLKDTIFSGENGFTFHIPDNKGVAFVLEEAFAAYQTDQWSDLIKKAMKIDSSWDPSSEEYIELYKKTL